MRANVVRGNGFRGALNYALAPQKRAKVVGGNLEGRSPRELASEFAVSRSLRPDCIRPVWHCSLSAPQTERPTTEQWEQAAELLMRSAGLSPEKHQYVVVHHGDAAHDHVHVYASRIALDGSIWHGQHEANLVQDATDRIERELGLTVTRDRQSPCFQPKSTVKCSNRETEMWARKGVDIPPKYYIAASLEGALEAGAKSWDDLAAALELDGIDLQKNKRGAGYRLNYVEPVTGEECSYKASDIGKSYSFKRVASELEENMNGQNRRTQRESQGEGGGRSSQRNITEPRKDESPPGGDSDHCQDSSKSVAVSSSSTETGDLVQPNNGGDIDDGNLGLVRISTRPVEGKSSELGQGRPKISINDAGNSSLGAAKSISIEGDSMDREALKIQVQEAIKEVLAEAGGERIELMKFAAALKERRIEAKLHYNERLKRIMGFGLDVESEHYQGHEVGIPWQSIRERIELPGGMKKLDKPVFTISSSASAERGGTRRTREEALEVARIRVPELFDGIEMSEEDGWGLFSNNTGEVLFFENPDGNSIRVNQNTYEAVAAALVYGHERWQGDIEVTKKDPEFAALCLKAADEHGIPISNREELERIVHGDMKPASTLKETPKTPFSAYAETLEKIIQYEGYASLGDNEAIKAGLRKKLDEMVQHGVEVTPGDLKALAEKLSSQIGYPEQSCIAEEYLQQLGHAPAPEIEDWQDQRPDMGW
ncbi:relaxase/mobilization nuclease domain-containing protein [uncultured Pseudodesulfovibrio sp.]|uniref:relaxase/mobilization nuclease domain-containing protein n=1 Tax=uncultured Pseudodesulfovibrio sp. TaxID=2035858 RepID=UPI0029C7EFA1|nr:relaxase/mobilization nuclease domain-containing protein [uncultured Pseudodesulfovibrio sp.]